MNSAGVAVTRRERAERPDGWTPVAVVLVTALVIFLVYWPTLASMVAVWSRSQTFAHGFLIPPLAVWLLARQRGRLSAARPVVRWWGAAVLAGCVLLWLAASLVRADVVSQAAMMAMLPATLLLVAGPSFVRAAAFPLVLSMLAVPAGEFLIAPMMDLTANGSVLLLQLSGVPVYQDGWLISIPGGKFQVADACSGVRYLIGAVTTGVLFAGLFFVSMKKRLYFMGFVICLTVVANVVRAYIIIFLAHLTDMRLAVGVDHFIYGWFLFSVLLVAVFAVGLHYADRVPGRVAPATPSGEFVVGLGGAPARRGAAVVTAFLLLLAGPVMWARLAPATANRDMAAIPVRIGSAELAAIIGPPPWLGRNVGWQGWHGRFVGGPTPFQLHVFQTDLARNGRDLTWLREGLDSETVTVLSDDYVTGPAAGQGSQVRAMRIAEHGRSWQVAYWFIVGGRRTANPVTAKLMEFRTIITGEYKAPAMIALAVDSNEIANSGASLDAMVPDVTAAVAECLKDSRGGMGCRGLPARVP